MDYDKREYIQDGSESMFYAGHREELERRKLAAAMEDPVTSCTADKKYYRYGQSSFQPHVRLHDTSVPANFSQMKYEAFTGKIDEDIGPKTEKCRLFNVVPNRSPDLNQSACMYSATDYGESSARAAVSMYRNDEFPIPQQHVGPGLTPYGTDGEGVFGLENMTRDVLPIPTVDDYRSKVNPKVNLTVDRTNAPVVGSSRAMDVERVDKNRPDTVYAMDEDDYFLTGGNLRKPPKIPDHDTIVSDIKTQGREFTQKDVYGNRYTGATVNANGKTYEREAGVVYDNERLVTENNCRSGNAVSVIKYLALPVTQALERTKKELFIENARTEGNIKPQVGEKPAMLPGDIPKTTNKETLIRNNHAGFASGMYKEQDLRNTDAAKKTTKETYSHVTTGVRNVNGAKFEVVEYDPKVYTAKRTMREAVNCESRKSYGRSDLAKGAYDEDSIARIQVEDTNRDVYNRRADGSWDTTPNLSLGVHVEPLRKAAYNMVCNAFRNAMSAVSRVAGMNRVSNEGPGTSDAGTLDMRTDVETFTRLGNQSTQNASYDQVTAVRGDTQVEHKAEFDPMYDRLYTEADTTRSQMIANPYAQLPVDILAAGH